MLRTIFVKISPLVPWKEVLIVFIKNEHRSHLGQMTNIINIFLFISLYLNKSNRKAINRNWSKQKAYPAFKTKTGNTNR